MTDIQLQKRFKSENGFKYRRLFSSLA